MVVQVGGKEQNLLMKMQNGVGVEVLQFRVELPQQHIVLLMTVIISQKEIK